MEGASIEQRLQFLEFDEETRAQLRKAREHVGSAIEVLLDRFYTHILKQPELRSLFTDADAIQRARNAQKRYWLDTLFDGQHGPAYFDRAEQVGKVHARIELTPNWYMGAYCYMLNQFVGVIADEYAQDGKTVGLIVQALNKAAALDMELVIDSYLEAKDAAMREILRRATSFADDAKHLHDDLRSAAESLQADLHSLADRAEQSKAETGRFRHELKVAAQVSQAAPAQPTSTAPPADLAVQLEEASARIEALADDAAGTASQANDVLKRADTVLDEIAKLNSRLDRLQFGDKLYYSEPPRRGVLDQLKALIRRHV
jgi:methyl-accepting chemotaxis protein